MITTIINATQDNQLQANADYVINWFGWSENDNTLSVMQKIEKNKDHYKKIYLDLVHQVGHKKNIKTNNNIINEMRITSEFSFWWMSLTSEKSPFRSNAVLNCIKLIALEDILNEKKITLAEIRTDDKIILNSIENLCSDMGIKENKTNKKIKIDPRSLFFVHQIKGLVYFARHIMTRLFFKTLDAPKWDSNIEKNLFIFSNFYNLMYLFF